MTQKTCFELRAALESFGLTQATFARLCGVQRKQVWRWCEGEVQIPAYVWVIFALSMGYDIFDVIAGSLPTFDVERHHVYRNQKEFRALAKRFHPDISGRDTKAEMQIINRLRKAV